MTIELDMTSIAGIKYCLEAPKRDQKNDINEMAKTADYANDLHNIALDVIRTQYRIEGAMSVLRELGIDVTWTNDHKAVLFYRKGCVEL